MKKFHEDILTIKITEALWPTPFETTKVGGAGFDEPFQVKSRPGYYFWLQVVSNNINFLPNSVKVNRMIQKLKTGNTET